MFSWCRPIEGHKGVDRYGIGDTFPQCLDWGITITSVPLLFEQSSEVKLSLFHSYRNVELWILCSVLFVCVCVFFNWYWLSISWHFISPKCIILSFNGNKEASASGKPYQGSSPGLSISQAPISCPANHGDRSTPTDRVDVIIVHRLLFIGSVYTLGWCCGLIWWKQVSFIMLLLWLGLVELSLGSCLV